MFYGRLRLRSLWLNHRYSMAEHRNQGNRYFSEKKYEMAATCYGRAIASSPHIATYYTNRALCYLKLEQWNSAVQDCHRALQIEPNLVKAYFFLGRALTELQNYDDAVASLVKAHDLAKQQHKNFGEDISCAVRQAKKMRWRIKEERRLQHQSELHRFLLALLWEHKERRLAQLAESTTANDVSTSAESIHQEHVQRISDLNSLFKDVDTARQKREVPDYLCGKISFDLMKDPCITPSGITFDRKDVEDHLQRVGHFDPVTREPLTQEQLIPNLALKEAVDMFFSQNGWVEHY